MNIKDTFKMSAL